jgi:Raf kinase inhibitor-like YbhB/YbcL family protein
MGRLVEIACLLLLSAANMSAQTDHGLKLTSSGFTSGAEIPEKYTCKGEDLSPTLAWGGAPQKTAVWAIIMDDPDAPAGTWVHWVMWNLPASARSLAEGVARREQLDDGEVQGRNSYSKVGYYGPCPPPGQTHRYFFRLYALDQKLDLAPGASRSQLDTAMKGHVLAQAEYMGKFHR